MTDDELMEHLRKAFPALTEAEIAGAMADAIIDMTDEEVEEALKKLDK